MCVNTLKKLNRPCVWQQGADGGCNGVHTFMSVGNSSFFTRPVAAAMFPMAPVVFSATAETHNHHIYTNTYVHTCNVISVDSADRLKACMLALFRFSIDYCSEWPLTHPPPSPLSMCYFPVVKWSPLQIQWWCLGLTEGKLTCAHAIFGLATWNFKNKQKTYFDVNRISRLFSWVCV